MSQAHTLSFQTSQRVLLTSAGMKPRQVALPTGRCGWCCRRYTGLKASRGKERTSWRGSEEAADFGPVIMGVEEALTMVRSKLRALSLLNPACIFLFFGPVLRVWVSLVRINHNC